MADVQVIVEARKTPKQARSRALVEAILDATARVLIEDGFARTTTNRVAERAGVSVGSLYQYFPSREALVAAVARRHSEHLKAALHRDLATSHTSLRSAINVMLASIVRAHRISPKLTAALSEEVPKLGSLDWKTESTRRGVEIVRVLLKRHADELRPDMDLALASFVCSTCVEGVMNAAARLSPGRISDGSVAEELRVMLLSYLQR